MIGINNMFLQLILHWFGDYITQSDWMALNKTKKLFPCFIHCFLYTLPFLFITQSYWALYTIFWSHFLIDHFSLTKYIIWIKNHLNPTFKYAEWDACKATGYFDQEFLFSRIAGKGFELRPLWITVWLYIITDNGLHVICNYLAIKYL